MSDQAQDRRPPFHLARLQVEQAKWLDTWAPNATAWQQVVGMCEEYLREAVSHLGDKTPDRYLDDIADTVIFCAGLCNKLDLDLYTYWVKRFASPVLPRPWQQNLGAICYHYLKLEQGIRGTPEEHRAGIEIAIGGLLRYLEAECERMGVDLIKLVERVWNDVVSKRDWNAERAAREARQP